VSEPEESVINTSFAKWRVRLPTSEFPSLTHEKSVATRQRQTSELSRARVQIEQNCATGNGFHLYLGAALVRISAATPTIVNFLAFAQPLEENAGQRLKLGHDRFLS
jgi:hypothetical protein